MSETIGIFVAENRGRHPEIDTDISGCSGLYGQRGKRLVDKISGSVRAGVPNLVLPDIPPSILVDR